MKFFLPLFFLFIIFFGTEPNAHSFSKSSKGDTLTSTDSILQFWLRSDGVDNEKPIAKTFYFWTSVEELDSVSKQNSLIRTQCLNDCDYRIFMDYKTALSNKKWKKNSIAAFLKSGELGRMRSAWPSYWAGMCDTSFSSSTQLVKVELEDSALIAVFRPKEKNAWQVFDLKGKILLQPEIEKRKSQIAVVYYADHLVKKLPAPHVYKLNYSERTFFLCNEKMIKCWQHAVPGMQKKIIDDLKYLLLLDAYLGSDIKKTLVPGKNGKNVTECWSGDPKNFNVAQYFFRAQQYASSETPEAFPFAIDQIIGALRYRFPRQLHAMEKFPSKGIR